MIILVGSHKGGVGKSTIYIHILMCLILRSGKRVAALECDDQHSVKDWLEDRRAQGIQPDVDYYECYHDIPAMARKLDKKYDIVLLDAPGVDRRSSVNALRWLICLFLWLILQLRLKSTRSA